MEWTQWCKNEITNENGNIDTGRNLYNVILINMPCSKISLCLCLHKDSNRIGHLFNNNKIGHMFDVIDKIKDKSSSCCR